MIRRTLLLGVVLALLVVAPVQAQDPQPPSPAPVPGPAPLPAPGPTPTPPVPSDRVVVGPPSIPFDMFRAVLQQAQSPMLAEAQAIYDAGVAATIDPAFALAVAAHESTFGTAPDWAGRKPDGSTTHNWGNVRCGSYARCYNGWREYTSWSEAAADWYTLIANEYVAERGLQTVETIIPVYAPAIENDTAGYITTVLALMQQWSTGQVQPPSSPSTGGFFNLDQLAVAPINGANYDLQRQATQLMWQQNQATLRATETLRILVDTLTPALEPILNRLGTALQPLGHALIVVGVVIAGLGLVLVPLLLRQQLVVLRAVPLLLVLIFGVIPVAGGIFVTVEQFRRSLGDTLYTTLFGATDTALRADPPTGTGSGLGDLPPLFAARTERHAVDVAAAYLMVEYADLEREDTLPRRFAETFFPYTTAEMQALSVDQRQVVLDTAARGFWRMTSGLVMTSLGQIEEAIGATFMVSLATITLAFLFTLVVAVFQPILRLVDALGTYTLHLLIWSLVICALQAFGMAFLFSRAATGTPGQVFGLGSILLVIELILLVGTLVTVALAFWHSAQAIGRFRPIAGTATLVDAVRQRLPLRPSFSALPRSTPHAAALGLGSALLGYGAARRFGAPRSAALAYALTPSSRVQRAGAVALALGRLSPDAERGLVLGTIAARGHPTGLRGLLAVRHAFANAQRSASPAGEGPVPAPAPPRRRPVPHPAMGRRGRVHQRPHRRHPQQHAARVVRNARRRRRQRGGP
jgi:hypothetical protein